MPTSPYSPEGLAAARRTVTDPDFLACLDPVQRAEILELAYAILRNDRACRVDLAPAPDGEALILRVPLAVFQAGRAARRATPPQPHVLRPTGQTPGDAA